MFPHPRENTLTVQNIDSLEAFAALKSEWDTLLAQCPHRTPFLTHDWMMTWWKHFGTGKELCTLVVREKGRAVAIAPLMRYQGDFYERLKIPMRVIETMANYESNRVDLIYAEFRYEYLAKLWEHLLSQKNWDCLRFYPIPADSPTVASLRRLVIHQGVPAAFLPDQTSPYLKIQGEWDAYARTLSYNIKRKVKKARKIKAQGQMQTEIVTQAANLGSVIDSMFEVSEKSWAGEARTAISSPGYRGFYEDLARLAHERGWFFVSLLKLGDRPVAYEYNLIYEGKAYNLKVGYDRAFSASGPGQVLRYDVLSDVFQNGHRLNEFDFLGNAEPYKLEWTQHGRAHLKIYLYHPHSVYGRLLHFLQSTLLQPLQNYRRRKSGVAERDDKILGASSYSVFHLREEDNTDRLTVCNPIHWN